MDLNPKTNPDVGAYVALAIIAVTVLAAILWLAGVI